MIKIKAILSLITLLIFISCAVSQDETFQNLKKKITIFYADTVPKQWAEKVPGVKTRIDTDKKIIALTFDACGSKNDGYDSKLINYLIKNNIPATLFINARWIDKYPNYFKKLASNKLFDIENHGFNHKPCSVNGNSIYGIKGTADINELIDEIELNAKKIEFLTGIKPVLYRSGTAYYDEIAAKIVNELGYSIAGFDILGDAGASYSKDQVKKALLSAVPGSIIICHMNHPEKQTAEGLIAAVPELKKRGFIFVKLKDFKLK